MVSILLPRAWRNPPILDDEWMPPRRVEADEPVGRRRAKGFAAGREVRSDQRRAETQTVGALLQRLDQLKGELSAALVGASDFRRFQLTTMLADVDRLIDQARRDLVTLVDGAIETAAGGGESHADEPVKAAGLAVQLPTGVDRVLVSTAFDNTADLLTDSMRQFQTRLSTSVRRVAIAGDGFAPAMLDLARNIDAAGFSQAAYRAERQVRTELSRVFNAATFERMASLADRMPAIRKAWIRTNDGRTRETHVIAGAQYARDRAIKVRDLFGVGRARMRFPVDPAAVPAGKIAASETILCRCNAVVEFDAAQLAAETQQRVSVAVGVEPGPAPPDLTPAPRPPRKARTPRPFDAEVLRGKVLARAEAHQAAQAERMQLLQAHEAARDINRQALAKEYLAARTDDERTAIRRKLDALPNPGQQVWNEIRAAAERYQRDLVKLLAVPVKDQARYTWKIDAAGTSKPTKLERRRFNEALRDFRKIVGLKSTGGHMAPIGALDGAEVTLRIGTDDRASAFNGRPYRVRNVINADRYTSKRVIIHELGHTLEYDDPRVQQAAFKFLERRTAGERDRLLADLQPDRHYKPTEITKPDKFFDPYVGKQYLVNGQRYATEVVSMGVENLYADPLAFARADPEHFRFIVNLLRGIFEE